MKSKFKTVLISAGIVLAVLAAFAAILIHGAWDYVSRCAHIKDRENIECTVGDTLSIDDLAEFSNYDTRRINGILGAEGEISEDGVQIWNTIDLWCDGDVGMLSSRPGQRCSDAAAESGVIRTGL